MSEKISKPAPMDWDRANFLIFFVGAAAVLGFVVWSGWKLPGAAAPEKLSPYSVVKLSNGEVYFGKLSFFPSPRISGAWILQNLPGLDGGSEFGIVPVNKAVWSPSTTVYLNKKHIILWSRLRADSSLAAALANPAAVPAVGSSVPGLALPPLPEE